MAPNNVTSDRKNALLAQKNKLLEEIKRYEEDIETLRADCKNMSNFDNNDSSDSEDDFPVLPKAPSISELQLQQDKLKTCLQATQELTNLMILQSEINVLVEDPKFEGEKQVSEAGTWQEVTAECRIDLVPFTITFYMHTPDRKCGPQSYRGLRVVPVKKSHETELENSVLHSLTRPSDAIEVLRSYAVAYRSRRITLAKLANKYTNSLFMEPKPEGFLLKCADLLEVTWRLENKWSPVAPFHHRMKFDLEYMDETYIKIITNAHKQLLDPSIQTDERTLLLAKIITTCLQAKGPIDTEESDLESRTTDQNLEFRNPENLNPRNLEYRDIVLPNSEDNDFNNDHKTSKPNNDKEVMAPPKSLPKKSKNLAKKRNLNEVNNDSSKKIKVSDVNENNTEENNHKDDGNKKNKVSEALKRNKTANSNVPAKKSKDTDSNTESKEKNTNSDPISKNINTKKTTTTDKTIEKSKTLNTNTKTNHPNAGNTVKVKKNIDKTVSVTKNARNSNSATVSDIAAYKTDTKNVKTVKKSDANTDNNKKPDNISKDKPTEAAKSNKNKIKSNDNLNKATTAEKIVKEVEKPKDSDKKGKKDNKNKIESNENPNKAAASEKIVKDVKELKVSEKATDTKTKGAGNLLNKLKTKENNQKQTTNKKNINSTDIIRDSVTNTKNINTKTLTKKLITNKEKIVSGNTKLTNLVTQSNLNEKNKNQNMQNIKNKENIAHTIPKSIKNDINTVKNKKSDNITHKNNNITSKTTDNIKNINKQPIKTIKDSLKRLSTAKTAFKTQNFPKNVKPGNTKQNSGSKISKIPQKKNSPMSEVLKRNILRISPRKLSLTSLKSTTSQESNKQKMFKITNIPRLLKKPTKKVV